MSSVPVSADGTAGGRIRLDDLQIVPRPRLHWEALDLGVLLARRWYGLLLASWLCLAGPVFIVLWLVLPAHPIWGMVLVWWCKPVFERIPLRILSTAIFAAAPSLKSALTEWRAAIVPGMAGALTFRRLAPNRSFAAPVWVLEGLAPPARQQRLAILQGRAGTAAFWLALLGLHLEIALALGAVTGVWLFMPSGVDFDWWGLLASAPERGYGWLLNLVYLLAMAVVAPVYVAAGFALYLNRRVELEAWDIELGFRRLAQRVTAVLLLAAVGLLPAASSDAAEFVDDPLWAGPEPAMEVLSPARQASRDEIYAVLAGADFNQQRVLRYPKFLETLLDSRDAQPDERGWLAGVFRLLAGFAEMLLWAALAGLVLWLVYRFRLLDVLGVRQRQRGSDRPHRIMGLAVDEQSLPQNIAATAMAMWNAGSQREALGLIYRATLAALIDRFHCQLNTADTEAQCLRKASAVLPEYGIGYLRELTRAWQFAAYGHALPDQAEFARLCSGWPALFGGEGGDEP